MIEVNRRVLQDMQSDKHFIGVKKFRIIPKPFVAN